MECSSKMSSYKNLFQEYCQKNKCALPRYETKNVEGTDDVYACHPYVWMSTVHSDLLGAGHVTGGIEKTKVEAEQSAAKLALEQINTRSAPKLKAPSSTAILIDGENCPRAYESLLRDLDVRHGYTLFTFATKGHPAVTRPSHPGDVLIEVPCTRKDAVDISLSMYLAMFIACCDYTRFVIITKDHFGACIPECVDPKLKKISRRADETKIEVAHYLSAESFLERERCTANSK